MRKHSLSLAIALLAGACSSPDSPTAPTAAPTPTPPPAPQTVRYRVTFDQTWSEATHAVPASPHFSALIGGTHDARARFWQSGALATEGIRLMAERGRQSPLDLEVDAARQAGTAEHVLVGGRPPSGSPGTDRLEFQISQRYPLVTLVSMVAPSPDWFVGVDSLPLFENGQWVDERTVQLVPWDAGTDSGTDFDSRDRATSPPEPITRIGRPPLGANGAAAPLGSFRFTRLN